MAVFRPRRLLVAALVAAGGGLALAAPAGASGTPSMTQLVATPAGPVVSGQPVTYTATVAPVAPATGVPTGSVSFSFTSRVGCSSGDSQALTAGVATCTVDGLQAANSPVTVTAAYLGDTTFVAGNAALSQTITAGGAAVTVTPSIGHAIGSGKPMNFTAAVTAASPATGTPTGVVSWTVVGFDGSTVSCSNNGLAVRVTRVGTAKCQVPSGELVASGAPWTITAIYSGDGDFSAATGTTTQLVHATSTTTHISSSPNPPTVSQPVTITASVSVPRFAVAPTGTITFAFSTPAGAVLAGVTCNGGVDTVGLTTTYANCTLPAGVEPHGTKFRVQATYSGDANNNGSTSNFRSLLVH